MKKQRNQIIALALLLVLWGVSWRINRIPPPLPPVIKAKAAKATQQDSPLKIRFHRVRAEMDALYHYRTKPAPFDAHGNLFRIPAGMEIVRVQPATAGSSKSGSTDQSQSAEFGEGLLRHAIAVASIGGVVTMNNTTQLTVDGQLHKEGDVFTTKVQTRLVKIRIKQLSTSYVTLALVDPDSGNVEVRVRLK